MSSDLHVREIFAAALQAVQPATVLPSFIQKESDCLIVNGQAHLIRSDTKIFAIAIGKASVAMMNVVHKILPNTIERSLVITKEAHATEIENCVVIEADHPVPGE